MLNVVLRFANRHTKHISYYLVIDEPPFIRTRSAVCMHYAPNKTLHGSMACHSHCLLPHTHRVPSLSWCRSLCQKWELFFVEPEVKSQWTVVVGCLTISTNVSCYQTRRRRPYWIPPLTVFVCFWECFENK